MKIMSFVLKEDIIDNMGDTWKHETLNKFDAMMGETLHDRWVKTGRDSMAWADKHEEEIWLVETPTENRKTCGFIHQVIYFYTLQFDEPVTPVVKDLLDKLKDDYDHIADGTYQDCILAIENFFNTKVSVDEYSSRKS